jgi:hypothetical protein
VERIPADFHLILMERDCAVNVRCTVSTKALAARYGDADHRGPI